MLKNEKKNDVSRVKAAAIVKGFHMIENKEGDEDLLRKATKEDKALKEAPFVRCIKD